MNGFFIFLLILAALAGIGYAFRVQLAALIFGKPPAPRYPPDLDYSDPKDDPRNTR